eukprot:gnl/MRDRNA2_/MRDRNA2_126168_c0_seq1.p1 gnl/MRDRNA2_/MRDRNA2_126168_c0~~gnl/MRDRNA2_/MRDRNA2_126168_c0_seq1.p1  ORF type:complete len:527 (-),score=87.59 gnl/MRDRNA2_/MRDRNA2_126168_c0_seq1:40-1461(-)
MPNPDSAPARSHEQECNSMVSRGPLEPLKEENSSGQSSPEAEARRARGDARGSSSSHVNIRPVHRASAHGTDSQRLGPQASSAESDFHDGRLHRMESPTLDEWKQRSPLLNGSRRADAVELVAAAERLAQRQSGSAKELSGVDPLAHARFLERNPISPVKRHFTGLPQAHESPIPELRKPQQLSPGRVPVSVGNTEVQQPLTVPSLQSLSPVRNHLSCSSLQPAIDQRMSGHSPSFSSLLSHGSPGQSRSDLHKALSQMAVQLRVQRDRRQEREHCITEWSEEDGLRNEIQSLRSEVARLREESDFWRDQTVLATARQSNGIGEDMHGLAIHSARSFQPPEASESYGSFAGVDEAPAVTREEIDAVQQMLDKCVGMINSIKSTTAPNTVANTPCRTPMATMPNTPQMSTQKLMMSPNPLSFGTSMLHHNKSVDPDVQVQHSLDTVSATIAALKAELLHHPDLQESSDEEGDPH